MKICLIDETGAGDGALSVLAARWGLEHDEDNLMALVMTTHIWNCVNAMSRSSAVSSSISSAGRWPTGANLAVVAAKRWRKRSALKAIICRMWWMRRRAGARCLCAGLGGLSRADAGA
jgi:hypothetical protein